MLIENISDLLAFREIVKQGSLSLASRKLGVSIAVISKRLKRLESKLSISLIARSTRTLRVTEEGEKYYKHCQFILSAIEEAECEISNELKNPKGQLKISVPAYFGQLYIAPILPDFLKKYPNIDISIDFSDKFINVIEDGYDLAVRIGNLKDSTLIAKKIALDQRLVVASPRYIKAFGIPKTPEELYEHNVLIFSNPSPFNLWTFFDRNNKEHNVKVSGNFETNNCESLNKAVLSGVGIALRPKWDVWRYIEEGSLVQLLTGYLPPQYNIQVVYPSRNYLPQRVSLFIEFLKLSLSRETGWNIRQ